MSHWYNHHLKSRKQPLNAGNLCQLNWFKFRAYYTTPIKCKEIVKFYGGIMQIWNRPFRNSIKVECRYHGNRVKTGVRNIIKDSSQWCFVTLSNGGEKNRYTKYHGRPNCSWMFAVFEVILDYEFQLLVLGSFFFPVIGVAFGLELALLGIQYTSFCENTDQNNSYDVYLFHPVSYNRIR